MRVKQAYPFLDYLHQWLELTSTSLMQLRKTLHRVAVKNHDNGLLNPKAHLRKKITIDDVMNSAVVASPLKLYDCCPFSDGASAVILCSQRFCKRTWR